MPLQLVEGQTFAADYSLISRLHRRDSTENWLALDTSTGERVVLRIFDGGLDALLRERVESGIAVTRGLIHPNIARVYRHGEAEGDEFIVSQYVRGGTPFDPQAVAGEDLSHRWPLIESLIDALAFAHGLSLAHGHLHPGNLLTDDQGRLMLTDFGLPAVLQDDGTWTDYISPQVTSDDRADISDDIFSLGQVLCVLLTGSTWREGRPFDSTRPVPADIGRLIRQMLSDRAWDRPKDLTVIRDAVRRVMLGEADAPLEAIGDFRRESRPAESAPVDTHQLPRDRNAISAPLALSALALLIAVAAGVFVLLPDEAGTASTADAPTATPASTPSAQNSPAASPAPEVPALTPLEQARLEQIEKDGAALAKEILRLQVELEDVGVQIWNRATFEAAVDLTAQADEAYRNEAFDEALTRYEQAKAEFEALKASVGQVLTDNIAAGNAAIEAGDANAAIRSFTIATAIDPEDAESEARLALAENLDTLLDTLDEAGYLEQDGKLDEAQARIREALDLEPSWQPASDALARIEGKIAQRRFNDAMSSALSALERGQFEAARESFRRAQEILPGSTEPADGLEQVAIGEQRQAIATLRTQADAAMSGEDWETAITVFDEILAIDSTLVFASEGIERARDRQDLYEELDRYVEQPTLMRSDEELSAARSALARAARLDDKGPGLTGRIDRLAHHIALARIPVEVEVRSDNRTEVTVYRYGELGRIDSRTISLIPGQYTIVGKRRGYQDAEFELTLLGDRDIPPVYIACTEKI